MEEEYSQKSSNSRYSFKYYPPSFQKPPFFFSNSVRALNRPFFTDGKGNEIDSELILISQSIQKLIDSLDKVKIYFFLQKYSKYLNFRAISKKPKKTTRIFWRNTSIKKKSKSQYGKSVRISSKKSIATW